jgi:hypothetical protein
MKNNRPFPLLFGGICFIGLVAFLEGQIAQPPSAKDAPRRGLVGDVEALSARLDIVERAINPGTIVAFGGATPPEGWLLCDGSALRSDDPQYKALFAAIGTNWGDGTSCGRGAKYKVIDKGTDFNIPDLRGYFLRGLDESGENRDPDIPGRTSLLHGGKVKGSVGSYQDDQFKQHHHDLPFYHVERDPGNNEPVPYPGNPHNEPAPYRSGEAGGNETRPKNAYVNFIIKR